MKTNLTNEEIGLLTKDLCARVPYGVKLHHIPSGEDTKLEMIGVGVIDGDIHDLIENFRPYLRPMDSMSDDEKFEVSRLFSDIEPYYDNTFHKSDPYEDCVYVRQEEMKNYFEWLNSHLFDYMGLIDKGLAIPKNI